MKAKKKVKIPAIKSKPKRGPIKKATPVDMMALKKAMMGGT